MNRRVLAAGLLVLLVASAGCSALGGGEVDEDRLSEGVAYDWNTTAEVTITIDADRYRTVYRLPANTTELALYRFHRFNNERPVDPIGPRLRYPNGTVVNLTADRFEKGRSETRIDLPAHPNGTMLGITAPKQGKRIRAPTIVEGSHEVILPPDARVKYPLLGRVIPHGYDRTVGADGRVHLRWAADDLNGDRIVVRYYLVRDLLLMAGLIAVAGVVLVGGIAYFLLQLRTLRRRREEVAWEGGDSGPP